VPKDVNTEKVIRFYKAVLSLAGNPDFDVVRKHIDDEYRFMCFNFHKYKKEDFEQKQGRAGALLNISLLLDPKIADAEIKRMIELEAKAPAHPGAL